MAGGPVDLTVRYAEACGLAAHGQYDKARRIYAELDAVLAGAESEAGVRALIRSDLAAIAALEGRFDEALAGWQAALEIDPNCLMARLNRDLIEAELIIGQGNGDPGELKLAPAPVPSLLVGEVGPQGWMWDGIGWEGRSRVQSFVGPPPLAPPSQGGESCVARGGEDSPGRPVRLAILSFLFNWPSTGGGNRGRGHAPR